MLELCGEEQVLKNVHPVDDGHWPVAPAQKPESCRRPPPPPSPRTGQSPEERWGPRVVPASTANGTRRRLRRRTSNTETASPRRDLQPAIPFPSLRPVSDFLSALFPREKNPYPNYERFVSLTSAELYLQLLPDKLKTTNKKSIDVSPN